jgi:hypothetical protein
MSRFKRLSLIVLLVLAGSTAAQMHVAMQSYYPVIRVSTVEGVTYTTLLEPAEDRSRCAAASKVFLASLKAGCEDCEVHFARCEREPEGAEALSGAQAAQRPFVSLPGLRIDIDGPTVPAARGCEAIARDLAARGLGHPERLKVSCTAPGVRDARTPARSRPS